VVAVDLDQRPWAGRERVQRWQMRRVLAADVQRRARATTGQLARHDRRQRIEHVQRFLDLDRFQPPRPAGDRRVLAAQGLGARLRHRADRA